MDSSSSYTVANNNVWLFNPNLIGYALSAGLDAFDGWAARKYKHSSRFGAMLDQLTHRCGTLSLVMALCKFFPDHLFLLQLSAVIDIASHWLHIHATDLSGASTLWFSFYSFFLF
ncbi:hypothetical protein CRE_05119 [Caenorhabditis remanei]|uniref:CDP-diacylglycerol--inositol 3-phosphatidyltransferase n=1 Tax=Caenorhabditis remanei TaxID=31234 RepID=E3N6A7_CAERE|nr:hypothetical protein CRE_05119 [Caenorhabditis remanei]